MSCPHTRALGNFVEQADPFATLTRYWADPLFRAELDTETEQNRRLAHAEIDAGIRKARLTRMNGGI